MTGDLADAGDRSGSLTGAAWQSPFGMAAVTVAVLTMLMDLGVVIAGSAGLDRGMVAMFIVAGTAPAGVGCGLAILSLIRREGERRLGHWGLWMNGALAVFAAPVGLVWMLAVR